MSTAPTVVATKKLSSIEIIEQELAGFFKQREQAIANVHAVEGAIQAGQLLLSKLKAAASKAETEVEKAETAVEGEATKVVEFVKKEV